MNGQLKQSINKAFEAPALNQQEKKRFLRTLPRPRISMLQFVLIQARYMSKSTLLFSVFLLFPALVGAYYIDKNTLWTVSALIPLLGYLAVAESTRSMMYGMSEFEMSARFSLKSVVFARMCILGLLDFSVLCCLIPLCCISSKIPLLQTGLYLLVPYLLTVTINLWITRCFQSKEMIYGCMSTAILVGGTNVVLPFMADYVYQFSYINWWIILCILLIGKMIYEIYHTIKQTEEYLWNSSLTD